MKNLLLLPLTLAVASAAAQGLPLPTQPTAESPATQASETNAAPSLATVPTGAQTIKEADTDEIDLEESDDSAEAALKPQVKVAKDNVEYIDISCDEATIADILRQFRKTMRANIIFDDSTNLQKRVSASLTHVPWMDALQSILKTRGFRLEERNGIHFVSEDKQAVPILTKSFSLNHASAEELATLFNENYGTKDAKGTVTKKVANAFAGANVVVVTAPETVLADCEEIIKSVDRAVAQIYIEARFLELSSAAMHKLGLQWDSLKSWRVTAKSLKVGTEHNRGEIATFPAGRETSWYTPKDQQILTIDGKEQLVDVSTGKSAPDYITQKTLIPNEISDAAGAGLSAASMAWRSATGFSGQLSADDFTLALSAFEELGEGKIFSNPKVIVSNGKEANIDMTTKFPNVDVTSQRNTSTTTPYTDISTKIQIIPGEPGKGGLFAGDIFYSWGITLNVKPRISPDGLISVAITPTISQLDTSVSETGFYQVGETGDSSAYGMFPIIEMKRIMTEFTMKDGATAVIGGLSKTVEDDIDSGIPYLRKIPWIGPKLFGWKSRVKSQKEIIVCVTIGIANPADLPKDMGLPKNAILGREYVEGKRLEPGFRKGNADAVLALDMEALEDQRKLRAEPAEEAAKTAGEPARGSVTITPSKEQ